MRPKHIAEERGWPRRSRGEAHARIRCEHELLLGGVDPPLACGVRATRSEADTSLASSHAKAIRAGLWNGSSPSIVVADLLIVQRLTRALAVRKSQGASRAVGLTTHASRRRADNAPISRVKAKELLG